MSGILTALETWRSCKRAALSGPWLPLALVMSLAAVARPGTGVWTTGGPFGGDVYALAVDPTTPTTLYAGTNGGGIFKSTNSGGTWVRASSSLGDLSVRALAIDPATPATLYAGTVSRGIYKSTNAGGSWTAVNAGLTNLFVLALAIHPTAPATLYAGTYGGVYKSANAGSTWTAVNTGLTSPYVPALAIDPTTPTTLYAGTGGGVFKSTNSGGSWTAASAGLTDLRAHALAIDPTTPTTLYAGTGDGVFKSTDSGGHWTAASAGLTDPQVEALAIDPSTPATLYAGTWYAVFKTTNAGGTWVAVNTGLTRPGASALAMDPTNPTTLYAGTVSGVFKTTNAAGSWAGASAGLTALWVTSLAIDPTTPTTLYAGTETGRVFRSTDSGGSWATVSTGLNGSNVHALAIDPATPTTLYAGTLSGIFRTTNAGDTWTAANTGLTYRDVEALAIDPTRPATLYAGTYSGGVFKSTNSGSSWAAVNTGLTDLHVSAVVINPATPSTLYAGTSWSGRVFKSTTGGAAWTDTGVDTAGVLALAVDPVSPTTLYAATNLGLLKSTNAGGTWAGVGGVMPQVSALAIDPAMPSTIYAGTPYAGYTGPHDGGVFRSTNAGATWTSVNKGLPALPVHALALDPTAATTLHAALEAGSVWQASPPAGADADLSLTISDTPDPVTGTTPLTYTVSVGNAGPGIVGPVSVAHHLPAGVVFDSASGSGWTCSHSAGVVTCARPGLAVGTAPNITVQVTPGPLAALLVSSATVSAPESDPNPVNNTDNETTTVNAALVWLGARAKTVLADSGEFVVNAGVTYTISLTNSGPSPQGDNPGHELADTLPSSLVLVSAAASSGTANADLATNTVTWDGGIPSGGSVTITIHATIGPRVALGTTVANQATASYDADGNGTNEAFVLTDDPGVSGANDPTRFLVVSPTMDFYTLEPCRLLDTRDAAGPYGGPALIANADRVFPLSGRCDIPPTARALSVNVTVTQSTANGNLRLYPAGTTRPGTSTINYVAGQTRANNAVAPLNGLGELAVYCSQASGTAHFVLDVNGYFAEGEP